MSKKRKTAAKNVATPDQKAFRSMEKHSTKLYTPQLDAEGWVTSMVLRQGLTREELIAGEMKIWRETHYGERDADGYAIARDGHYTTREEAERIHQADESEEAA